jgi:hypothetical protein
MIPGPGIKPRTKHSLSSHISMMLRKHIASTYRMKLHICCSLNLGNLNEFMNRTKSPRGPVVELRVRKIGSLRPVKTTYVPHIKQFLNFAHAIALEASSTAKDRAISFAFDRIVRIQVPTGALNNPRKACGALAEAAIPKVSP